VVSSTGVKGWKGERKEGNRKKDRKEGKRKK